MRRAQRLGRCSAALAGTALALALAAGLAGCGGGSGAAAGKATGTASSSETAASTAVCCRPGLKPHGFTLTDQYGRRVSLSALARPRGDPGLPLLDLEGDGAADRAADPRRAGRTDITPAVPALAISVDPTPDTPAHVRAFLRANSLTGRLEYLTGNTARLRAVWRAYHVVPASAGEGAYERGAFVLLARQEPGRARELLLEELTPEVLAHDVRKLEAASRAGGPNLDRRLHPLISYPQVGIRAMMFSTKAEYGVRVMVALAQRAAQSPDGRGAGGAARGDRRARRAAAGLPRASGGAAAQGRARRQPARLARRLHARARAPRDHDGRGRRGAGGLDRPDRVHLAGPDGSIVCSRESSDDPSRPPHVCPTKLLWTRVRMSIVRTLLDTTLADLARSASPARQLHRLRPNCRSRRSLGARLTPAAAATKAAAGSSPAAKRAAPKQPIATTA